MSTNDQTKGDNPLYISWCDSRWVPVLNATNVLEYFTERTNPFYSKDCNNEFLKMQQNTRMDQLTHMQGTEYCLLHAQDPILYIIRKQHRYSPAQINPLSCYHIIAGQVFQTPDLGSVINSRLVSTINQLSTAFSELQSLSQYHPSKGYSWQTPKQSQENLDEQKKNPEKSKKEEISSVFQRRRVDSLLSDLATKFPYKFQPSIVATTNAESIKNEDIKQEQIKTEVKSETKQENSSSNNQLAPAQRVAKPPPEKRQKLNS